MASVPGASLCSGVISSLCQPKLKSSSFSIKATNRNSAPSSTQLSALSTEGASSVSRATPASAPYGNSENGSLPSQREAQTFTEAQKPQDDNDVVCGSLQDYFDQAMVLIRSVDGPPRWFSPVECGGGESRLKDVVPLLLYLPGIDGTGLGLLRQHKRLGNIFDVWCLHIPVADRTSFTGLVNFIETTVSSEHKNAPRRPIYLVGESLGSCLALAVAARNPQIDLVLILANPATSFSKSPLQLSSQALQLIPVQSFLSIPYLPSLMKGDQMNIFRDALENGIMPPQSAGGLWRSLLTLSSYFSVIDEVLPRETFLWRMEVLQAASAYANSRLHAVKSQTIILSSGRDQLLPSQEEGERLRRLLSKCELRKFNDNGHFLFLEDGVDLVYTIKCASFYRAGRYHDYVADFILPTPSDCEKVYDQCRWYDTVFSPVLLSTLENGEIVRGATGIPSEGPVLLVGYHMLLGFELVPLVKKVMEEKNILLRGMAHPMMFSRSKEGNLPDLSAFDTFRIMGATPVSGKNLFKLLSSKSHVILYPGGLREALHRKGEEYKLMWPEQSEFVRMAARFGAKIVPFGAVGEDDISQLVVDYNDQMRIPYWRTQIEELTNEAVNLRTNSSGEVTNQDVHLPIIVPKVPGRIYLLFGKPIETEGRKEDLKDRKRAHELYLHVKSEVEKCIYYLKDKREHDPYRSILARTVYQATNGSTTEIPTFDP